MSSLIKGAKRIIIQVFGFCFVAGAYQGNDAFYYDFGRFMDMGVLPKQLIHRHTPAWYCGLSIRNLSPAEDHRVLRVAGLVGLHHVLTL
jgi:hypothetical protein